MGIAPDPNWSTGTTEDGGDADSPVFCPAECDTTLQNEDRWFWVRLSELNLTFNRSFVFVRVSMQHFVLCQN